MIIKLFIIQMAFGLLLVYTNAEARNWQPNTQKLVDQYLNLANSLVKSDLKKSKVQAVKLAEIVATTGSSELQTKAAAVAFSSSLPEMRSAFSKLSTSLKVYLSTVPALDEPIYVVHCPMALNDTGAIWLTDEKKVVNPYFGMEMLHCGTIQGTINPGKL